MLIKQPEPTQFQNNKMTISFSNLFESYLNGDQSTRLALFGLPSLNPSDLKGGGYDSIGDILEVNCYEKGHLSGFGNRHVYVLYKLYFLRDLPIGDAVGVGPGVRLISLFKIYNKNQGAQRGMIGNVEFYFSAGKQDGAVIFNDSIVVRFEKRSVKSGYSVSGIETDTDKSDVCKNLASCVIKSTMERFDKENFLSMKHTSPSLRRLISYFYQINRWVNILA